MVAQPQKQTYMMLEDRFIYDRYISYIYNDYNSNSDELIIKTAKFFLNTPYIANTLEFEPEGLALAISSAVCPTFTETDTPTGVLLLVVDRDKVLMLTTPALLSPTVLLRAL